MKYESNKFLFFGHSAMTFTLTAQKLEKTEKSNFASEDGGLKERHSFKLAAKASFKISICLVAIISKKWKN